MELREIPIDLILRNPEQPRKTFTDEDLQDLAETIRLVGVSQPIIVEPYGNRFMLVAGERRWRSAALAGLDIIPAIIRPNIESGKKALISLIENIQRVALNPMETARYISYMKEDLDLTQEEISKALGSNTSRAGVAHYLRLLNLPLMVQRLIENNDISFGHAKVLCGAPEASRERFANETIEKGLSVRQLEKLIKSREQPKSTTVNGEVSKAIKRMEEGASECAGYPVRINTRGEGKKGKVEISYSSFEELDGIMKKIGYDTDS